MKSRRDRLAARRDRPSLCIDADRFVVLSTTAFISRATTALHVLSSHELRKRQPQSAFITGAHRKRSRNARKNKFYGRGSRPSLDALREPSPRDPELETAPRSASSELFVSNTAHRAADGVEPTTRPMYGLRECLAGRYAERALQLPDETRVVCFCALLVSSKRATCPRWPDLPSLRHSLFLSHTTRALHSSPSSPLSALFTTLRLLRE